MVSLFMGIPSDIAHSTPQLLLRPSSNKSSRRLGQSMPIRASFNFAPVLLAAAVIFSTSPMDQETLSNIPQSLSGEDGRQARIQKPKSRKAESCTAKCVGTCIRGGGEGPLNVRRPLVVFKQGFRSRHYCLVECSDVCNLIKDGEDGP